MKSAIEVARPLAAAVITVLVAAACTGASGTLPGTAPTTTTSLPAEAVEPVEAEAVVLPAPATTTSTTTTVAEPSIGSGLPDITAAPIDAARLITLLPALVPGGTAEPQSSDRSNAALVAGGSPDREDEQDDVNTFGRVSGAAAAYETDEGETHIWIDLLPDPGMAHGYLLDAAGDVAKGIGPIRIGATAPRSVEEFPVDGIGDESIGLILTNDTVETAILTRIGRLVVMTSLVADRGERRVAVQYLAEEAAAAIVDALRRGVAAAPITAPIAEDDAAAFELIMEVTTAGTQGLAVHAQGVRSGPDLACVIEVTGVDLSISREVRIVGGSQWARDVGGDWLRTGSANARDTALLAWCPAWPLRLEEAGLQPIADGEAATLATEELGELLGYRGDTEMLETALGSPLRGTELEIFNAWVTAEDGSLVEVNLEVSGTAAALAPLTGMWPVPDDWLHLTLRHRISALGDDVPVVRPPT